jgi:hypothetical protein
MQRQLTPRANFMLKNNPLPRTALEPVCVGMRSPCILFQCLQAEGVPLGRDTSAKIFDGLVQKGFINEDGKIQPTFDPKVHINMMGFGPKINSDEHRKISRSVTVEYGIRKLHPLQDKVQLTSISLVSAIILKITELILFEKHPLELASHAFFI